MQDSTGDYKPNDRVHTAHDPRICPRYLVDKNAPHQRIESFCNLGLHNLWDLYNGMQTSPSKLICILKGCRQIYLLLSKTGNSILIRVAGTIVTLTEIIAAEYEDICCSCKLTSQVMVVERVQRQLPKPCYNSDSGATLPVRQLPAFCEKWALSCSPTNARSERALPTRHANHIGHNINRK